ncbi:MAG: maleylpyruvate isomerase N-terminal domain-containing protein [Egibacteraceae bacterium]
MSQGHDTDRHTGVDDHAMRAFITAASSVHPSASTWCVGWSAHDLVAHVAAADAECADLIEEHLAGRPTRDTRSWEEREAPYLALPYDRLRDAVISNAARFGRAVSAMAETDTIEYTGWTMSPARLRIHSHSEAAMHRYDLVGDDPTSQELLSKPALTKDVVAVFDAIPGLAENRRWVQAPFTTRPLRLRASGQPDVLVEPGSGLSLVPPHR